MIAYTRHFLKTVSLQRKPHNESIDRELSCLMATTTSHFIPDLNDIEPCIFIHSIKTDGVQIKSYLYGDLKGSFTGIEDYLWKRQLNGSLRMLM